MKVNVADIDTNEFSWAEGSKSNCFVVGRNTKVLPSAFYTVRQNDDGSFSYYRQNVKTDELLSFKNSLADEIMSEIQNFWKNADKFKQYGFLQRRGYMFYGPPGSGKTAITEQIVSATIANGGVAFMCRNDPEDFSGGLAWFRKYEPERQIVCLFEDIDSIISKYGESDLLSCLDGENQVDHVLNIATTNYPEELDKRIINRPRRFDRVVKIGFPESKIREQYFINKLKISPVEVKKWVSLTKNFSFAAMTDLVINVKCFGYTLDDSAKKVAATMNTKADSKDF
jgi:SpoVK/Ycf46/Vps4 family AAA+-type ATPase